MAEVGIKGNQDPVGLDCEASHLFILCPTEPDSVRGDRIETRVLQN